VTIVAAGAYHVVGLGDSVPAGAACGCTSYVQLVGERVAHATGRTASVDNLAQSGLTTAMLQDQLDQPDTRLKIAAADLVIVTVGANDFDSSMVADEACGPPELRCYQDTLNRQQGALSAILARINAMHADGRVRVMVTGYWDVFLDGEVGRQQGSDYVRNSKALTLADNSTIAAAAVANSDTYVDLYATFKGDGSSDDTAFLAADGDHPDAEGHRRIAATLADALCGGAPAPSGGGSPC
jgi:lysophospholipase L1-like esterase